MKFKHCLLFLFSLILFFSARCTSAYANCNSISFSDNKVTISVSYPFTVATSSDPVVIGHLNAPLCSSYFSVNDKYYSYGGFELSVWWKSNDTCIFYISGQKQDGSYGLIQSSFGSVSSLDVSKPGTTSYICDFKGFSDHFTSIDLGPSHDVNVSDSDILNFNWKGNGLKIYNLKKDMKVSGYQNNETSMKWFDIECYGKFLFTGRQDLFFFAGNTLMYKNFKTTIQNGTCMNFGSFTRRVGEGLGVKSFEWVDCPDSPVKGDELKFRMVLTAPMLSTGNNDITIGTSVPKSGDYEYVKDIVESVNFLSDNYNNYPDDPVEGGTSGKVGSTPGNNDSGSSTGSSTDVPQSPTDGSIISWLAYFRDLFIYLILLPFKLLGELFGLITSHITEMIDILLPFSKKLKELFCFIPEDILDVCYGVISFTLVYSVYRSVMKVVRGG